MARATHTLLINPPLVAEDKAVAELAQVKADADKARQEAEEAVDKAQKAAEDAAKRAEDAEGAAAVQRRQMEKVEAEMAKLRAGHDKALQLADEKGFLDGQKHAFNTYEGELDALKPIIHFRSYTEGYRAGHAAAHAIATSVSPVTSATHQARWVISSVAVPPFVDFDVDEERARQGIAPPPAEEQDGRQPGDGA